VIYINQKQEISVDEQWKGQPLQTRELEFRGWGYVANDGDQYYVIE
jgi:hypothetical protein